MNTPDIAVLAMAIILAATLYLLHTVTKSFRDTVADISARHDASSVEIMHVLREAISSTAKHSLATTARIAESFKDAVSDVSREGFAHIVANHPFEAQQALAMRDAAEAGPEQIEQPPEPDEFVTLQDGSRMKVERDENNRRVLRDAHGNTYDVLVG